jgi:hypothetical protein
MNAADYRPIYDDSVYEFLPGWTDATGNILTDSTGNPTAGVAAARVQWAINKQYCLMPASAVSLASLFDPKPAIVNLPPIGQATGSPFAFNHNVPWLKFADGTLRNAAVLASYWGMPGVPYAKALDYAKLDVATPVEGQ